MTNNLRYRVNFGNGQVHYPEPTRRGQKDACYAFIREHGDGNCFIEFEDPDTGEWFATRNW